MRCEIKNGRNSTYTYRKRLKKAGFKWITSGKAGMWEKDCDKQEMRKWKSFCKRHKLKFTECNPKYMRSSDYRKAFFNYYAPDRGTKYRCVYCGHLIKTNQITVDHIIPVNKALRAHNKSRYRRLLALIGAKTVNDPKNLAAACWSCNSQKSDKAGMWIAKGFLGRSFAYWTIKRSINGCLIILFAYGVYFALKTGGIV